MSDLLWTTIKGISDSLNFFTRSSSNSPHELLVMTSRARSIISSVLRVRSTLFSPTSPESSIPAVSTSTTGPKAVISNDFFTGSVVVPAWSPKRFHAYLTVYYLSDPRQGLELRPALLALGNDAAHLVARRRRNRDASHRSRQC
jgi:hypothetical protein